MSPAGTIVPRGRVLVGAHLSAERPRHSLFAEPGAVALRGGPLQLAASGGFERGSPTCLLDGFLFEPERLAATLELPPSTPEEELVAAGFSRWGGELPRHLDGEFALVAWDEERRRGLIAVDRLAAGPIFLCVRGGALHFASELRELLLSLPSRPGPDEEAIAEALSGWALEGDRTLYRGVRRLGAAGVVELDHRGFSLGTYWRPSRPAPIAASRDEATEEIRRLLGVAVRRRTRPGGTAGVLLSGGLDSGAVAAVGSEALAAEGTGLTAFSARFPDFPAADESAQLEALDAKLGLPSTVLSAGEGSALAAGIEFLLRWEVPLGPPNHFAWQPLLRRAAEQGIVEMLDGNGGDEVFAAATALIADRLAGLRLREAVQLASSLPGPRPHGPRRTASALYRLGLRGLLGKREGEDRWWAQRRAAVFELPQSFGVRDYARRAASSAGLLARHPLEDLDLIGFLSALPPEWSFDRRLDRPLLREATRGLVPDEVRLSPRKAVFNQVFQRALLGRDLPLVRELVGGPTGVVRGHLPVGAEVEGLLSEPGGSPAEEASRALALWRLVNIECWLRSQHDPASLQGFLERARASDRPSRTFFSLANTAHSATL